jgi:hypothetical protein
MKLVYFDNHITMPGSNIVLGSVLLTDPSPPESEESQRAIGVCKNVGETQCCGSLEVFGEQSFNPYKLIELIKDTNCAIFHLHWRVNNAFGYALKQGTEIANELVAPYFTIHTMLVDDGILVTLEIPDYKLYLEWKKQK